MLRKLGVIVLVVGVLVSGVVHAESNPVKKVEKENIVVEMNEDDDLYFLEDLGVSKEDYAKIKKLAEEIDALDAQKKYDEADKKWAAYNEILEKYFKDENFVFTWAGEKSFFESLNVDNIIVNELSELFKVAKAADEKGNNDIADINWQAYFDKADSVIDANLGDVFSFEGDNIIIDADGNSIESFLGFDENTIVDFKDFEYTFDVEKEYLESMKVNKKDLGELEKLFNKAKALEDEKKYDESEKVWVAYDEILDKYYDAQMTITWDEFKKDISDLKLKAEDEKALQTLFDKAIKLDKESKYEEAKKTWEAFDKLFEQLLK